MKDVRVSVIGKQVNEEGEESVLELISLGRYYHKNGIDIVTYRESKLSGMEGTTTMLKIYPDSVILVRTGAVEQKQIFRLGEKFTSPYITPYGKFIMSVFTKALHITKGEVDRIEINYDVSFDEEWLSNNTLIVEVREDKKNGDEG